MKSLWILPRFPWILPWVLLLSGGCISPTKEADLPAAPQTPRYAVFSAFGPETLANQRTFLGNHRPDKVQWINGVQCQWVRYSGHDLVLLPSGVSMVNAAMTTQWAIDRLGVTTILFAGVAGGINPSHGVGDVVVPERWAHHSEAAYFNPDPDGKGYRFDPGFRQKYENFGFIFPVDLHVVREGDLEVHSVDSFAADTRLLEFARSAVSGLPVFRHADHVCSVTVGGTGVSGPVFCDNRAYREWAFRVWKAECLDMESTAVAQVCWANHVPFLIVRSLSDLAGGQEGQNPEEINEPVVAQHASEVVAAILRAIPADSKNGPR